MNSADPRATSAARGFTLIEVLVAFAIAAIMLGALFETYSTSLKSVLAVQHYREAVLLGESALDAVANVPLQPGDSTDRIGIYDRSTIIRSRADLLPAETQLRVIPYEIDVQVGWRDGLDRRAISLTTLRLAPSLR
jgi:general secretion pathway protein I